MTTPTMVADRLRWWQYFGPWPLRPGSMFFAVFVIAIATTLGQIRVANVVRYVVAALLVAGVAAATFAIFQRVAPRWSQRPLGYIAVLSVAAATGTVVRGLTNTWIPFETLSPLSNAFVAWIRAFIFAAITLAILGVSSRRLQIQVHRTEHALAVVRQQADALLRADEAVRQQVAALLHDRVQAGLIAACLQIQDIGQGLAPDSRSQLSGIVASLERIRSLDVRRAVRSLSPNLNEVDFESALRELADFYHPAITTTIRIDVPEDAPLELRLGAYRIIEQSLLNTAGHGFADQCQVSVTGADGAWQVSIRDNGRGLPADPQSGFGSTLISTWCRNLGGDWSRSNAEGGGVLVTARLPLSID